MKYLFKLTRRLASARTSAALVGLLAGFSACSKDAGQATAPVVPPPPNQDTRVATVVISPATVSGSLGESGQFTATARNAGGVAIPGQTFTWSVSDPTLAMVNSSGFVTTLGVGPVTVSASVGAITGGASVTVAGEPVSAVMLSPSEAVGSVGQVAQFNATLMGGAGNVLNGRPVLWSSDNPSVVAVDSTGRATQRSVGTATISAVSASFRGTARVTVGPRQIPAPGAVTDLTVLASSDTSATLSFTQVSDGMGMPATYSIRFSPGAIVWSTAALVPRGSCAPSLAGTASGGALTCSVLGLLPLQSYSFQLVAYRGNPDLDAVYGAPSNVATGTTTATPVGPIVPVAEVKVSPPAATASLGIPVQMNATAHDARGGVLVDRPIVWSSSDAAVVTLSPTGLATTHRVGRASITAASGGHAAVSALTVTPATATPASVTISPAVVTLSTGATQSFSATVSDASGGVLPGQVMSWSSSNRSIATVSAGGLVTAKAVGTVTITATSGALTGSSNVTVVNASVPPPGTVSDLTVLSTTDSSATLSFGQIDNGLGQPALYNIRFTVSPIGFGWSSATSVTRGTCKSPLAGSGVSGTRSCTVFGLAPSTNYDFRMVAYRLSSGANIPGALSNVASATTSAASVTPPGPPASVSLTPSSASIEVGGSLALSATVRDAAGVILSSQTITWRTNSSSLATVTAGGVVVGVSPGTALITASTGGKSGTANLTVSGPSGSATPFLLEDFSTYTGTANFLANPRGFYAPSEDLGTQDIVLDPNVGFGGSTQSMRYDFPARTADVANRCNDQSRRRVLTNSPPYVDGLGAGRPHIWVDIWMKFSANFTVSAPGSWGCQTGQGYKLHSAAVFGPDEGRFMIQQLPTEWTVEIPDNTVLFGRNIQGPMVSGNPTVPQNLYDNQWHRFRYEMKISSAPGVADGLFNGWLDDQPWFRSGPQVINRSTIWGMALGANMNQGPATLQRLWYGRVALYAADPGW